jgi:hypothetical protein
LVTREAELDQIEKFLASNATHCPTVYVQPTSTDLSTAEEARRLALIKSKVLRRADVRRAAHRFYLSLWPQDL